MASATTPGIGKEIRDRREAVGLSREGLAYKAGVAHKTIERIEAGGVEPRRATLTVIEAALKGAELEVLSAAFDRAENGRSGSALKRTEAS